MYVTRWQDAKLLYGFDTFISNKNKFRFEFTLKSKENNPLFKRNFTE